MSGRMGVRVASDRGRAIGRPGGIISRPAVPATGRWNRGKIGRLAMAGSEAAFPAFEDFQESWNRRSSSTTL